MSDFHINNRIDIISKNSEDTNKEQQRKIKQTKIKQINLQKGCNRIQLIGA
jgi:hypothetical protein